MVPYVDYLWQADLLTIKNISRKNKGYEYLLTVIDVLSRFAFVEPIKKKTGKCVADAFRKIVSSSKRQPNYLQTDQGLEFFNSNLNQFLSKHNIYHFHNHSPLKAAMIERFNRTLMNKLYKYFTFTGDYKFLNNLQDFVSSYNQTIHSTIKIAPADVNKYNQLDVWLQSYKDVIQSTSRNPVFKVGDFVRLRIPKSTFWKGYRPQFSQNLYSVSEVVSSKPITYKLTDPSGASVLGTFYQQELSKVPQR
jgi:hypothetical protein